MAQEDKASSKTKQTTKSKNNNKKASTDTKSTRSKNVKTEKVVEEAKKSLTSENKASKKVSGKASNKSGNKKKDAANKGLTSYEEQALQGATKSKGNKKLLIILLLLLGLVVIGVGIALLFILQPKNEESKAVVCEVTVLSYSVNKSTDPEDYIVIGSGDKFKFTKDTQTTSSFTKDIDVTITDELDFAMTYLINNVTENAYSYTLDFSSFEISNCNVVVKVNNGKSYNVEGVRKVITISQLGDVVLEVRVSGINPPVYDENDQEGWLEDMQNWATNTWCDGSISLTLEVN